MRSQSSGVVRGMAASAASSARREPASRIRRGLATSIARPAAAAAACDQCASGSASISPATWSLSLRSSKRTSARSTKAESCAISVGASVAVQHEQHVVAVRGEAQRREHAALPVAGGRQHAGMALEAEHVVRELALQEGARVAAGDRDDGNRRATAATRVIAIAPSYRSTSSRTRGNWPWEALIPSGRIA